MSSIHVALLFDASLALSRRCVSFQSHTRNWMAANTCPIICFDIIVSGM